MGYIVKDTDFIVSYKFKKLLSKTNMNHALSCLRSRRNKKFHNTWSLQGNNARSEANQSARTIVGIQ